MDDLTLRPLTPRQLALWAEQQLAPGITTYHIAVAFHLLGELSIALLQRALDAVVRRHPALRSRIVARDGAVTFHIGDDPDVRLDLRDRAGPVGPVLAEVERAARAPFDLAREAPIRVTLWRLGDRETVLLVTVHHIVFDAESMQLLLGDLSERYGSLSRGLDPSGPSGAAAGWPEDGEGEPDLAAAETPLVPHDRLRRLRSAQAPPIPGRGLLVSGGHRQAATAEFPLRGVSPGGIRELCHLCRTTPFVVLLAAVEALLSTWARHREFLIVVPVSRRPPGPQAIDFLVDTEVIVSGARPTMTTVELIADVRSRTLAVVGGPHVPLRSIIHEMRTAGALDWPSRLRLAVSAPTTGQLHLPLPGIESTRLDLRPMQHPFDMIIGWSIDGAAVRLRVDYDPDTTSDDRVAWMAGHLDRLVEQMVAGPERRLADLELLRGLEYWGEKLRDAPVLELPGDRSRRASTSAAPARRWRALLGSVRLDALRALCHEEEATLVAALLAAFATLLGRCSRQDDLLVGTPARRRVGLPGSLLALRLSLRGRPSFRDLVHRVRDTVAEASAHAGLPPDTGPSRGPLLQVALELGENDPDDPAASGDGAEPAVTTLDLALRLVERADGLQVDATYRGDLFDAGTIERLLGRLDVLLAAAADAPDRPVAELPLMTTGEVTELERRRPRRRFEDGRCLHELFEERARRHPDAVAVGSLTYRELNRRANQIAHHLRELGCGRESPVALRLERSVEQVVAMLGVSKAGGASVPLDTRYPEERQRLVLEDSGARLVVTSGMLEQAGRQPDHDPAPWNEAGDAAYVIYTSGSTGTPKGVVVEHRNVTRLLSATRDWFGFGASDVWTLFHSYAFDFSVWEVWGALLHGGRLVIVPEEVARSPEAFHELLWREGVTVLNQTPSAFAGLIDADAESQRDLRLRWVIFGGERLDFGMLAPWFRSHPADRPRLVNMYGITETTVHVSYRAVRAEEAVAGLSLLGEPIPDLGLEVVDRELRPVPAGVPGELLVSGDGVARGYLNRPDLTAERFVPDSSGARRYRSGDLVRRTPGGDLEYLGRLDEQVKVRGYRIEPGEVEAALRQHAGVRAAAVVVRDDRLVACVVGQAAVEELARYLRRRLPAHMVPAAWVPLDELPLTPSGKLDRRALREARGRPVPEMAHEAPRTPAETTLTAIWQDVLGLDRVGVTDNFFELGGDSISSVQIASRARQAGLALTSRSLFEAQTVAALAGMATATSGRSPAAGPPRPAAPPRERRRLVRWTGSTAAPLRLICFPYAGAAASVFRSWAPHLLTRAEMLAVQLPGRASRVDQPAARSMVEVLEDLLDDVGRAVTEPTMLYGHSLGALVAFEVARRLPADARTKLAGLIVSGCLPPRELAAAVHASSARDAGVPRDPGLPPVAYVGLDGDRQVAAGYRYLEMAPLLDVPITAVGAADDEDVPFPKLAGWGAETVAGLRTLSCPGGHFFPWTNEAGFLKLLRAELDRRA